MSALPGKDPALAAIHVSIGFDRRLWREDIDGSLAHVRMLGARGIVTPEEARRIEAGLDEVRAEIAAGTFPFREEHEDIHLNVEKRLTEKIGEAGGRLHTGRSRNDQVATDLRLFTARACADARERVRALSSALVAAAERELLARTILPFYTHLQRAQPVLLAHHLLAHVEALSRDARRLEAAERAALAESPLGAGAGAGSGFPIDPAMTAAALGFAAPCGNSLDAVSARDFALEALSALAILMTHLSRLAEELVLWSSAEFGFARLSDAVTTGSSIMPQKRNPDGAELVRGKSGRVVGHLVGLLTVVKALPLAYNKDLQEDKEAVFDAFDTARLSLDVLAACVREASFDRDRMRAALLERAGYANATELADDLARKGVPFREAHGAVKRMVAKADAEGKRLEEYPLDELRAVCGPLVDEGTLRALSVEAALERRAAPGGTAPARVAEALARAKARLDAGGPSPGDAGGERRGGAPGGRS
jgi:argininosuccinate lyase